MRLHEIQRQSIKTIVADIVGAESRIWLFGSRVDDTKRGGDIDLLIETDAILPNRVEVICKLEGRFAMALGDRKIDILLKDTRTALDSPIYPDRVPQASLDTGKDEVLANFFQKYDRKLLFCALKPSIFLH